MSEFNEQMAERWGGPEAVRRLGKQVARAERQRVARERLATVICWCGIALTLILTAALTFLVGYGAYRGWLAGW